MRDLDPHPSMISKPRTEFDIHGPMIRVQTYTVVEWPGHAVITTLHLGERGEDFQQMAPRAPA